MTMPPLWWQVMAVGQLIVLLVIVWSMGKVEPEALRVMVIAALVLSLCINLPFVIGVIVQ